MKNAGATDILKRIANETGVSTRTVLNVLAGRNKETWPGIVARANHIRELAEKYKYRPNAGARAIRTGRFQAAALLTRSDTDFFPFGLYCGLDEALTERGMHLVAARLPRERIEDEAHIPRILQELCVDGLLIHEALAIPRDVMEMVRRLRVPAIWINEKSPHNAACPDERDGTAKATRRLLEWGHRRIAYCDLAIRWRTGREDPPHYSKEDRRRGYRDAMQTAGWAPREVCADYDVKPGEEFWGTERDDRIRRCREVLRAADRPTAIVGNLSSSAGPWVTAAASLGLDIPRDLSVAMVDHRMSVCSGVNLTVYEVPLRETGHAAVRMLEQKIRRSARNVPLEMVFYGEPHGNSWGPAPTC
jgi:LacI family transcriptional regulator